MKRYIKNIDGKDVIKYSNEIIVIHGENNEWQTINPSEELILADGWVEYVVEPYIPTEEEKYKVKQAIELAKANGCTLCGSGYPDMYWGRLVTTLAGSMHKITKLSLSFIFFLTFCY